MYISMVKATFNPSSEIFLATMASKLNLVFAAAIHCQFS